MNSLRVARLPIVVGVLGLAGTVFFACAEPDPDADAAPSVSVADAADTRDAADASDAYEPEEDAAPFVPSSCSPAGFCKQALALSRPVTSLWGRGEDAVFVTTGRRVMAWDGKTWATSLELDPDPTVDREVLSVAGTGVEDVWALAIDDGGVFLSHRARRAGVLGWKRVTLPASYPSFEVFPSKLHGIPAGVWLTVGTSILRITGEDALGRATLVVTKPPAPTGIVIVEWSTVFALGTSDVWAGGIACPVAGCEGAQRAALAHWNGATWTVSTFGSDPVLGDNFGVSAIFGSAAGTSTELWFGQRLARGVRTERHAVPADGGLGAPTYVHLPSAQLPCAARVGLSLGPSDVWFSGGTLLCAFDGSALSLKPTASDGLVPLGLVMSMWGSPAGDVWISGQGPAGDIGPGFVAVRRKAGAAP